MYPFTRLVVQRGSLCWFKGYLKNGACKTSFFILEERKQIPMEATCGLSDAQVPQVSELTSELIAYPRANLKNRQTDQL